MKNDGKIKMLCKPTPLAKERGASSLEYLMLGVVVIIILGIVIANGSDVATLITSTLEGLFGDVDTLAEGAGSTGTD